MRRSRTARRTAPCPTARTARSHRGRRCSSIGARDARGRYLRTRGASVQWRPLRWSYRLAQIVKVFHANAAALAGVCPDLLEGDDVLMLVTPGIPDEDRERADQADDREPPDVPDDREPADRREERADHPDGRDQ